MLKGIICDKSTFGFSKGLTYNHPYNISSPSPEIFMQKNWVPNSARAIKMVNEDVNAILLN